MHDHAHAHAHVRARALRRLPLSALPPEILALVEAGRLEEAETEGLARVRTDPENAPIWGALAVLAVQRGDLAAAVERSDRAVALRPDDAGLWLNRGNLDRLAGRTVEAGEAYERASRLAPDRADIAFTRAAYAEEQGDPGSAEAAYRALLDREPAHGPALHNLARLVGTGERAEEAAELWARATEARPFSVETWRARAHHLRRIGSDAEAIEAYEEVLRLDPTDATSDHLLRSLRGEDRATADPRYVEALFDRFASTYDEECRDVLGYRGAETLAAAVRAILAETGRAVADAGSTVADAGSTVAETGSTVADAGRAETRRLRILDLGCGTGLFAEQLSVPHAEWVGIDLSAEMLERARGRGRYARLERTDVLSFLAAAAAGEFDLVAAADVFVYVGDLEPVFRSVRGRLAPGGLFAFTVERADEADARSLRRSGRFAHGEEHLRRLARAHGYETHAWERGPLRRERGAWLEGLFVVLGT